MSGEGVIKQKSGRDRAEQTGNKATEERARLLNVLNLTEKEERGEKMNIWYKNASFKNSKCFFSPKNWVV